MTSFCTSSGRFDAKYIALRPPIDSPTRHERGEAELIDDAADVVEGHDARCRRRRVAVAVAALVDGVHVEVRLERDAERVPGVGVAGEAVQEQQRCAAVAAPVEDVEAQTLHREVAIERPQQIHGRAPRRRVGLVERMVYPYRPVRAGKQAGGGERSVPPPGPGSTVYRWRCRAICARGRPPVLGEPIWVVRVPARPPHHAVEWRRVSQVIGDGVGDASGTAAHGRRAGELRVSGGGVFDAHRGLIGSSRGFAPRA